MSRSTVVYLKADEEDRSDSESEKRDLLIAAIYRRRLGIKKESSEYPKKKNVPAVSVKYSDDQPRDDNGRWSETGAGDGGSSGSSGGGSSGGGGTSRDEGTGFEMVSPNVREHMTIDEAIRELSGTREREVMAAAKEIDSILSLSSEHMPAIGAWADGAENSMIARIDQKTTYDKIETSAAMKGLMADQKAVIPFHVHADGPDAMYSINIPSKDIKEIHSDLEKMGIEYHTLQPTGKGTTIWIFDKGTEISDKVKKAGEKYGTEPKGWHGTGNFVGGETRAEGRAAYEEVIRRNLGPDEQRQWQRFYRGWRETHPEVKAAFGFGLRQIALLTRYSDDQPRDDNGRWTEGGGGGSETSGSGGAPIGGTLHGTISHTPVEEAPAAPKPAPIAEAPAEASVVTASEDAATRGALMMFGGDQDAVTPDNYVSQAMLCVDRGVVDKPSNGMPKKEPHLCYNNSIDAMVDASMKGERLEYREGYVIVHGVPISHAWNYDPKTGRSIDFTATPSADHKYVGVNIPRKVLMEIAGSRKFGSLDDGVLASINAFGPRKRAEFVKAILAANPLRDSGDEKSLPRPIRKYSDQQERDDHGRWTDGSAAPDDAPSATGTSTGAGGDSRTTMPPATVPNPEGMTGFNREYWTSMSIMDARTEWDKLSSTEKDRLAGPEKTIAGRVDILTSGKEGWKNSGDMKSDITNRVNQFRGDRMTDEASRLVEEYAHSAHNTFVEAGAKPEAARELAMKVTDYLIAQDFEAAGRTLGDHGIHHLSENVRISGELLKVTGQDTPEARAAMYLAGAFHDAGYLTPPSRAFLDDGHPRWSAQNFEKNLAPMVKDALGEKMVDQLSEIIGKHDSIEIDWEGAPLKSAFATADNISLFHYEKMPALLRYVPDNTKVLVALAEKNIDAKEATALMLGNIDNSHLSDALKHQLRSAAYEVSPVLPKYVLGMVGVKLQSVKWEKDHPRISLRRYASNEAIGKVADLGQRQFSKLAETYGQDAKEFAKTGHLLLTQNGKPVLEFDIVNRKAWEGLLTALYLGGG